MLWNVVVKESASDGEPVRMWNGAVESISTVIGMKKSPVRSHFVEEENRTE